MAKAVEFGEAVVAPLLHATEEVDPAVGFAGDFDDIFVEGLGVLDVGGIGRRVEALVQVAEEVVLAAADVPERPLELRLVLEVDDRGFSPGHLFFFLAIAVEGVSCRQSSVGRPMGRGNIMTLGQKGEEVEN